MANQRSADKKMVGFYVTTEEHEQLKTLAEQSGHKSMTDFFRATISLPTNQIGHAYNWSVGRSLKKYLCIEYSNPIAIGNFDENREVYEVPLTLIGSHRYSRGLVAYSNCGVYAEGFGVRNDDLVLIDTEQDLLIPRRVLAVYGSSKLPEPDSINLLQVVDVKKNTKNTSCQLNPGTPLFDPIHYEINEKSDLKILGTFINTIPHTTPRKALPNIQKKSTELFKLIYEKNGPIAKTAKSNFFRHEVYKKRSTKNTI